MFTHLLAHDDRQLPCHDISQTCASIKKKEKKKKTAQAACSNENL